MRRGNNVVRKRADGLKRRKGCEAEVTGRLDDNENVR